MFMMFQVVYSYYFMSIYAFGSNVIAHEPMDSSWSDEAESCWSVGLHTMQCKIWHQLFTEHKTRQRMEIQWVFSSNGFLSWNLKWLIIDVNLKVSNLLNHGESVACNQPCGFGCTLTPQVRFKARKMNANQGDQYPGRSHVEMGWCGRYILSHSDK